jgi:outer membrane biosynthesis protein TonB
VGLLCPDVKYMSNNPLFPTVDNSKDGKADDPAVRLIRDKVARAYSGEPDAVQQMAEAQAEKSPSKHQLYMREISSSGKSLAEIQTAWHHYYTTLPDAEKHAVWQEFYAANQHTPYQKLFQKQQAVPGRQMAQTPTPSPTPIPVPQTSPTGVYVSNHQPTAQAATAAPMGTTRQLKAKIASKVSANGKLSIWTRDGLYSSGHIAFRLF